MNGASRLEYPLTFVWSAKSATAHFFPLTPPMPAAGIRYVRPTMVEVRNPTNSPSLWVGCHTCDDPSDEDNWSAATDLTGSYLTSTGRSYAVTAFEDISASLTKRYVRFGFQIKNTTGTAIEACHAGLILDLRSL